MLPVVHHRNCDLFTGAGRERRFLTGPFLRERLLPFALEIQGVQQIGQDAGVHLVQDAGDEPVRVVRAPFVDDIGRSLTVVEIQAGGLCLVVFVQEADVIGIQAPPAVHHQRIGYGQRCLAVQIGKLLQHGLAVGVHGSGFAGTVTQHPADFVGRSPGRSVKDHAQQKLHAERGDDIVLGLASVHLFQETEGKIIALLHKFGRFGREVDDRGLTAPEGIVVSGFLAGKKAQKHHHCGEKQGKTFHTQLL